MLEMVLNEPGSMGDTYSRFYNYSYGNQVLLLSQGVREPVASYERWKALGRQVRKGTTSAWIRRPISIHVDDAEDPDGPGMSFTKFKLVRGAHPYSHTDGEDLPPYDPPQWDRSKALSALDIREIAFAKIDGNTMGYSRGREFAVNPMAKYPLGTTMHELAHIVHGHTDNSFDYAGHRGIAEFQAEATAYLLMHEIGEVDRFDPSESRAYVQGWLRGKQRPADHQITAVFGAVDKILTAGTRRPEEKEI
jgi:hypothetical protein